MLFAWDDKKNEHNERVHGIDFDTASKVFEDPFAVNKFDAVHSTIDEDRYDIIGMVNNLLFVVYTQRVNKDGREITQIISARKANRRETDEYDLQNARRD